MSVTRPRGGSLAVLLMLLVAVSGAIAAVRVHDGGAAWRQPDAAIFLRMTLERLGRDARSAEREAARIVHGPADAPASVEQRYDLFRTRTLLPRVAALLYPRAGPRALQLVSAAAYAGAVLVLFGALLPLAPRPVAFAGALAFALLPPVNELAAKPDADALALFCWTLLLAAALQYVRRGGALALGAAAAAALLLVLAKPLPYEAAALGIGALAATRLRLVPAQRALALAGVTAVAAGVFLVYETASGTPGLAAQIRWDAEWAGGAVAATAPLAWYLAHLSLGLPAALFVAAFAYALRPHDAAAEMLGAAALSTAAAAMLDPVDPVHAVLVPLAPIVVVTAAMAFARVAAARRLQVA